MRTGWNGSEPNDLLGCPLNVSLQGQITNLTTGVTFSWSAAANGNVSGETTTTSTAGSITDDSVKLTDAPQTVVYTVTPTSSLGCVGDPFTVTVTVNPEPVGVDPLPTTCSDTPLNVNLDAATANLSGDTFSWTVADNINVTGEATGTQTTSFITDDLVNLTGGPQTVVYTVTPTSSLGCVGDPFTVTVTVNPEPVGVPQTVTVCENVLNIPLAVSNGLSGVTYSWIVLTDNTNVDGESLTASTGGIINDNLVNNTTSVQTVTYTVTPSVGGCVGDPFTVTVLVNPDPSISIAADVTNICTGGTSTLTATVAGGDGCSIQWQSSPDGTTWTTLRVQRLLLTPLLP